MSHAFPDRSPKIPNLQTVLSKFAAYSGKSLKADGTFLWYSRFTCGGHLSPPVAAEPEQMSGMLKSNYFYL